MAGSPARVQAAAAGFVEALPRLGILSALIVAVGGTWIAAGAMLKGGLRNPGAGYRAGAVALVVIAAMIAGSATMSLARP